MNRRLLVVAIALAGACAYAADPAGDVRAGRALAYAECRGCHGMDGKGTGPGIPDLGGRDAASIMAALEDYRSGRREHGPIRGIARSAKPQELRDIAAYYAAQPRSAAQPASPAK
jgi:cytochrome c553